MGLQVRLFMHLVLILVIWKHASSSRAMVDDDHALEAPHSHHHHPMMDHVLFFKMEDLHLGKTMTIRFPDKNTGFPSSHLLPREEADKIPFSLKLFPHILQLFSISQPSLQADTMKTVLTECESKPLTGEIKFCATSLESMLDFSRSVLGPKIKILSSTMRSPSLQNYTVVEVPQEIPASNVVSCHTAPYPYVIFMCHYLHKSRLFKSSLVGETNGDRIELISTCHLDTSDWSPDHIGLQVLGSEPGKMPVCHFLMADNFAWIPLPSTSI